jgi:hypothetical protein
MVMEMEIISGMEMRIKWKLYGLNGIRMVITNYFLKWKYHCTETIAIAEKTFRECLYKAAIAESNGNVRLWVKVANSVH